MGWDVSIDLWQSKIQEESEKASWSFISARFVPDHFKEAKLQSPEHMVDTQLISCPGMHMTGTGEGGQRRAVQWAPPSGREGGSPGLSQRGLRGCQSSHVGE